MRAGILRDRIRLEKFTATEDAVGGPVRTWASVGEVNCQIMEQSAAKEFYGSGTEVAEGTVRIRMREFPADKLDAAWRAVDVDRGDIYEIVAISPSRTRNDITIVARHGGIKR